MSFIKAIREEVLGLSQYEMHKEMQLTDTRSYIAFENSRTSVNIKKLVHLWRLSGLSGDEFMEYMAEDVEGKQRRKSR